MKTSAKNATTAERLRLCREEAHETLEQLGALVGVNKSTVLRWERGSTAKINAPTLQRLAQHFSVDVAWLSGEDVPKQGDWLTCHALPLDDLIDLPVWGSVKAGMVRQDVLLTDALSPFGENRFWLQVTGDSMAPLINEGDLVLVRRQSAVDNGNYAILLLDGTESMIRRVECGDDWIELQSVNPYYPSRRFTGADTLRVRILGVVLESKRKFI